MAEDGGEGEGDDEMKEWPLVGSRKRDAKNNDIFFYVNVFHFGFTSNSKSMFSFWPMCNFGPIILAKVLIWSYNFFVALLVSYLLFKLQIWSCVTLLVLKCLISFG